MWRNLIIENTISSGRTKLVVTHTGNALFLWALPSPMMKREMYFWIYSVGLRSWEIHMASHHPSCSVMRPRAGNGCGQLTLTLLKLQEGKEHWKQGTTENLGLSWSLVVSVYLSATVIVIIEDTSGVCRQQNQLHHLCDWRDRLRISSLLNVYKAVWEKGKQRVQEWKTHEINILEQKNLGIRWYFWWKTCLRYALKELQIFPPFLCSFWFLQAPAVHRERVECVVLWKSLSLRQRALKAAALHIPVSTRNTSSYQWTPRSPLNFWCCATSLSLDFVGCTKSAVKNRSTQTFCIAASLETGFPRSVWYLFQGNVCF